MAKLRAEVDVLQEQVKRLVRTERRLSLTQRYLDRELQKVETLTNFDLTAIGAERVEEILREALRLLLSLFSMEQGLAFHIDEEGSCKLALAIGSQDIRTPGEELAQPVDFPLDIQGLPQAPWIGQGVDMKFTRPERLFSLMRSLSSNCPADTNKGKPAKCTVMILPISGWETNVQEILIAGCMGNEPTLLDTFPQDSDLPFLRLLCAHIRMSIRKLEAYQKASDAVRARDDFLSIASHELKTPLTSILLAVDLVKRDLARESLPVNKINMLERQCRRQAALIEQLLDVSRIRAGHLEPRMVEFDCAALVRDVCAKLTEDIKAAGSPLSLDLPAALSIVADPSQIEQVITNLISNAIKYGRGRPISLRLRQHIGGARLRIRDHGLGISEADRKRIFLRFERAVSNRNFGGLGLGLYISRKIVEAHLGLLSVRSVVEKGSIFVLELPVRPKSFESKHLGKEALDVIDKYA